MSNLKAAQSGDRRSALIQARDTLAAAIDRAEERGDGTIAQLAAQYRATLSDIEAIDGGQKPGEVSELDRIRRQREARGGDSADRPRAAKHRK